MNGTALRAWTERCRIKAQVGHLIPRKQQEIERMVRLLRAHFIDRRRRAPKRGTLHCIMLVGPHACPGDEADRETGDCPPSAPMAQI